MLDRLSPQKLRKDQKSRARNLTATRVVATLFACSNFKFKTKQVETVMINTKNISLLVCLAIGLLVQPTFTWAQGGTTLREDQRAVVVLDLRIGQLIEEFVAAGFEKERFEGMQLSGPLAATSVSQVERIYGATSLPKDIETLNQIVENSLLKDFPVFPSVAWQALTNGCFLQIKFVDKPAADQVEASWKKKTPKMKMGGFNYNIPWGQKKDDAFFAQRVDEMTIEFGSKGCLLQSDRSFFTDRLNAAYQAAPQEALRLVLDLETRRDVLKNVIKLGKKEVPRTAHAYLELVEILKSVALTHSFNSENLMSLIAEANSDADAEEVAAGLSSVLQIGKVGFATVFSQISRGAPEGAKEPMAMVKGMVDGLKADQSGATVKVLVKKPENFVAMLGQFTKASLAQFEVTSRKNRIRQVALAVSNYSRANKYMPFKADAERAHPSLSWRTKLLPFIKGSRISRKMDMAKAATEAPNAQFANQMPKVFGADGALSNVMWVQSKADSLGDVTDGASNTIMVIESPQGRPWLVNKPVTIDEAVAMVKGLADGEELYVGLYDSSVSTVTSEIAESTLRSLLDPSDGNAIDASWKK